MLPLRCDDAATLALPLQGLLCCWPGACCRAPVASSNACLCLRCDSAALWAASLLIGFVCIAANTLVAFCTTHAAYKAAALQVCPPCCWQSPQLPACRPVHPIAGTGGCLGPPGGHAGAGLPAGGGQRSCPLHACLRGESRPGQRGKSDGVSGTGLVEGECVEVNATAPSAHPQEVLSGFTLAESTWQTTSTGMHDAAVGSALVIPSHQTVDLAAGCTSSLTPPLLPASQACHAALQAVTAAAMLGVLTFTS